jgi:hypothetical protein
LRESFVPPFLGPQIGHLNRPWFPPLIRCPIHKVPARRKSTLRLPGLPFGFLDGWCFRRPKISLEIKNQILKLKYDKTPDNQKTLFHASHTVLSKRKYEFYLIYFAWDSYDILKLKMRRYDLKTVPGG